MADLEEGLLRIPTHNPAMADGLRRYINHGIPPGHFLQAVIKNDLKDACIRADDFNRRLIWDYVYFFYNYAPSRCWGGEEQFDAWVEHKGLDGLRPEAVTGVRPDTGEEAQ